eukprot:JP438211.1.p2 GENE.JP438211.1~~JP438211.1.p2  ORF type:complete len:149 (-),score=59.75 JP438211.1:40-432(-)
MESELEPAPAPRQDSLEDDDSDDEEEQGHKKMKQESPDQAFFDPHASLDDPTVDAFEAPAKLAQRKKMKAHSDNDDSDNILTFPDDDDSHSLHHSLAPKQAPPSNDGGEQMSTDDDGESPSKQFVPFVAM